MAALLRESILAYILGTGRLECLGALLVAAVAALVWMMAGAYALWDLADRLGVALRASWEGLQTRVEAPCSEGCRA